MNILAIGNPIAGRGKTLRVLHELADRLSDRGHRVEVFFTRARGDARRRAGMVSDDVDVVLAAGGDGLFNEVLNGLRDPGRVPLLPVPTGTANMLAGELGVSAWPSALVRVVEQGTVRRIDLGTAGDRRFLMVAGAGFDAAVAKHIADHRGATLGYRSYALPILTLLQSYRPVRMHVELDGRETFTAEHVMALKVRQYGGVFTFAGSATLDSGVYEVLMLAKARREHIVGYAVSGLFAATRGMPGLTRRKARHITISSEEPVPVQMDGEFIGTTPVDFHLTPSVVPVLVP